METRLPEEEGLGTPTIDLHSADQDRGSQGDEGTSAAPPGTPSTPRDGEDSSLSASEDEEVGRLRKERSVALCRTVVEVALDEEDAQCCSICLDDFTVEDPTITTTCGHGYHLQCIMQWAQRSRECPLCFRALQLEDEDMNALLPFGEFVDPQAAAATAAMLENWELERFLVQLAVAEQRERRAARAARRQSHPQGRVSAPRPIFGGGRARSEPAEAPPGPSAAAVAASAPGYDAAAAGPGGFPASWPPRAGDAGDAGGPSGSSHGEGLSQTIKSRWASLRFRESLNKTTKELRSLFGAGSGSGSRGNA